MRTSKSALAWIGFLLGTTVSLLAFTQRNNAIQGRVYGENRRPLENVPVILQDNLGLPVDRTTTGSNGEFLFTGIGLGVYQVSVEPPSEYLPQTRQVEILGNQALSGPGDVQEVQRVDFHLTRAQPKTAPVVVEPKFFQEVPPGALTEYEEALKQLENGERKEGFRHLHRAVEIFPDFYEAYDRLGLEYAQDSEVAKAFEAFQKAFSINSNSASSAFGLGWALYQDGQFEPAYQALEISRQLNSRVALTHYYFGLVCYELKKTQEAIQGFEAYLNSSPKTVNPDAHLFLASLYDREDRIDDALEAVDKYLAAAPAGKDRKQILELKARLEKKRKKP